MKKRFLGVATAALLALGSHNQAIADEFSRHNQSTDLQQTETIKQDTIKTNIPTNIESLEKKVKNCPQCHNNSFKLRYARMIHDMELYKAKEIVEKRFEKAPEMSTDKEFYKDYLKDVHKRIKYMNTHYQEILSSEKRFEKEFNKAIGENGLLKAVFHEPSREDIDNGLRLIKRCRQYTKHSQSGIKAAYLEAYNNQLQAFLLDDTSQYDLKGMTRNDKRFTKTIKEIIENDPETGFKKALQATKICMRYDSLQDTNISRRQLHRMQNLLSSRMTQERKMKAQARDQEENPEKPDKAVSTSATTLSSDTLNPEGIYRYGNKMLVVLNYTKTKDFQMDTRTSAVRPSTGALINAGAIKLSRYVDQIEGNMTRQGKYHKVTVPNDPSLPEGCLVPYLIDRKQQEFLRVGKNTYQARILFHSVKNERYTQKLREQYLPTITVEDFRGKVYESRPSIDESITYYELAGEHRIEHIHEDTVRVYKTHPKVNIREGSDTTGYRQEVPQQVIIEVTGDKKKPTRHERYRPNRSNPALFKRFDAIYRNIRSDVVEYVNEYPAK